MAPARRTSFSDIEVALQAVAGRRVVARAEESTSVAKVRSLSFQELLLSNHHRTVLTRMFY